MTVFKRTTALLLLLVCVFSIAACGGTDASMDDLEAIKTKLTAKGYQAQITDPVEISMVNQLEATNEKGEDVTVVLFRDEQSAVLYFEIMKDQMDYYIEQNEAEAAYLAHMLSLYEGEMSAEKIAEAKQNVAYFQKCANDTKGTVCVRHGKAVVMAMSKDAYEACK